MCDVVWCGVCAYACVCVCGWNELSVHYTGISVHSVLSSVCTHAHTHTHTHACTQAHIHAHTCMHAHTHTHTHTHTHPVKKTRKETYFSHKLCAVLRVLCRSRFSTPFSGNIETDTAAGTRHGYGPTGTLMTANGPPHRRLVSHWTSAFCGPHGVITGRSPSARKRS